MKKLLSGRKQGESPSMACDLPRNYEFFFHFLDRQVRDIHNRRILDYGCGNGFLVRQGISRGYQFFGVDNFYGDVAQAQTVLTRARADKLPMRVLTANNEIPWPDGFFDVIISPIVPQNWFEFLIEGDAIRQRLCCNSKQWLEVLLDFLQVRFWCEL